MPVVKIIQCGYMSGDTYTAAALLKLDPLIRILLIKDTRGIGAHADKSGLIRKIYEETGVLSQVEEIDVSKKQFKVEDVWAAVKDKYKKRMAVPPIDPPTKRQETPLEKILRELSYAYAPIGKWPRSITAVTGLLAERWQADPKQTQNAIAEAWKSFDALPNELKAAMLDYMAEKFAKLKFDLRKNVVVLWSRQSGKKGGAHLELDSSFTGIRQLAYHFAAKTNSATVLLAGDEKNGKLADLATNNIHVVDVSEMWKDPIWTTHFGEATFVGQFAFFKCLARDYTVIHLGMRSGMLEAMALLGMKTFFLEPISLQDGSGKRMLAFQRNGITYNRIQINTPPGLTGRIVDNNIRSLSSKEKFDQELAQKVEAQKSNDKFKARFPAGRAVIQGQVTPEKVARECAKVDLLRKNGEGTYGTRRGEDYCKNPTQGKRGFRDRDLEAITRMVCGAMK